MPKFVLDFPFVVVLFDLHSFKYLKGGFLIPKLIQFKCYSILLVNWNSF